MWPTCFGRFPLAALVCRTCVPARRRSRSAGVIDRRRARSRSTSRTATRPHAPARSAPPSTLSVPTSFTPTVPALRCSRGSPTRARASVSSTRVHGIHVDKAGSRARQAALLRVERRLRSRTAAWICVCGSDLDTGEHLKLLKRERSHVVYNGIEMPLAAPPSAARFDGNSASGVDTPLALSIGRFDEQKDQRTLLDAWASARHVGARRRARARGVR